jgi:eukaryotic-like serine/threonine-protein kinase
MLLSPGDKLGPYEIVAAIGKGGMGEVWKARDPRLNRDVAIKVSAQQFSDRFEREAHAIAALNHPNICTLFDVGPNYLVMEEIEGATLAERIKEGPIPLEEAIRIARQIGGALEAAHEKGIVHRDLKPANIKIRPDGSVKVLDFGLAKAGEAQSVTADSPTMMAATQMGMIMGTAGYMSPEQARGKEVDKRADIWAFGVVLNEMLTGKTTFEGETVSDTLAAVLRADIEWKELPAGTPPKVRRLLQRCLERDPRKRLRDIGDAWIEIDAPEDSASPATVAVLPRQSGMWWLGWVAAVVVGGAGLAWALLHHPSAETFPVVRWMYSQKALFAAPALSRDGTKLQFTTLRDGGPGLTLRFMDQAEPQPVPGTDRMVLGEFSPDGQWIVAFEGQADAKLQKLPVTGGTPITLANAGLPGGASWGDDGTIVFSGGKGLMRIPGSGGAPETLTTPDGKKGETLHRSPHFLPGSQALLFTIGSGTATQVAALDLKTRAYHVVAYNGQNGRFAPDSSNPRSGHLVYTRGNTLFAAPFDARKLEVTGSEAPVVEGLSALGGDVAPKYALSENGLLVYMEGTGASAGTTMGWLDLQGHREALSETVFWGTGRLSPEGRRIANAIHAGTTSNTPGDIWVFDTERKIKTRLTFGGVNSDPIWTPDGRRITWSATAGGKSGIYWTPADGSGKPEQLLATDSTATPGSWSPDGKFLLYSQTGETKQQRILVLPVTGGVAGKPYPLHDAQASETYPEFSPDGRWVAYASAETGQQEVYVQPFPGPGARERVSAQSGGSPRWARNGRELYYQVLIGNSALMVVDVQTSPRLKLGSPRVLANGLFGSTFDTTPDGKRFLVEIIASNDQGEFRMIGIDNWFAELKRRVPLGP